MRTERRTRKRRGGGRWAAAPLSSVISLMFHRTNSRVNAVNDGRKSDGASSHLIGHLPQGLPYKE
ncbi:hypothetical protein PAMP_009854 [Pampus punctatissimus]